jgi:hypothetical protein
VKKGRARFPDAAKAGYTFTDDERILITEKDRKGHPRYRFFFENLKQTSALFTKMRGRKPIPLENNDGLRRAIKVRDRLTHPKNAASLDVADDELKQTDDAFGWFNGHLLQS